MSFVVTLISDPRASGLDQGLIDAVTGLLRGLGYDDPPLEWLAPGRACDIGFDRIEPDRLTSALRTLLADRPIDFGVQPAADRRKRLLVAVLQDELKSLTGSAEAPDVDTPIVNDEMDSLLIVEFRDRLQAQIGARIELPATIVFDHPKISDLAAHLLLTLGGNASEPAAAAAGDSPAALAAAPVAAGGQLNNGSAPPRMETAADQADRENRVEKMSEAQAMEALLREVND